MNKIDGVFTGETRTITRPDPAGISPNDARPEQGAATGMGGAGWSGNPKVPDPRPDVPLDLDANRAEPPDDVAITPVPKSY